MFKTKYIFTEVDNFFGGSKEDEDEVDDGIDDDLEDVDDTEPVEDDTEILVDEDQPQTKPSRRIKLMRIISSLYWQVPVVLLILLDVSLLVVEFIANYGNYPSLRQEFLIGADGSYPPLVAFSLAIVVVLLAEVLIRVAVWQKSFFYDWVNVFELIVMVASLVMFLIVRWLAKLFLLLRLLRLILRLVRVSVKLFQGKRSLNQAVRTVVTENKMRYIKDGWDLDLSFITDSILAMSLPAFNYQSLYRNNIDDVVRFLNEKYPKLYTVINCCAEKYANYPIEKFQERVIRVKIEDHNVPSLFSLLSLCEAMYNLMQEDPARVMVVHCKGGKGRTGTVICAYLLYSGQVQSADEALDMFGKKRTDPTKKGRIQGVETASQRRYVNYFAQIVNQGKRLPTSVVLNISRCQVRYTSAHNAKILGRFQIGSLVNISHIDGNAVFGMWMKRLNVMHNHHGETTVEYGISNSAVVNDIRVVFYLEDRKPQIGTKKREICFFYFWFHTAFVGKTLKLTKTELDQNRKWKKSPFKKLTQVEVEVHFEGIGGS